MLCDVIAITAQPRKTERRISNILVDLVLLFRSTPSIVNSNKSVSIRKNAAIEDDLKQIQEAKEAFARGEGIDLKDVIDELTQLRFIKRRSSI
ncbi:hypothetical protein [Paenibacillus crassostreae]|uniref:Uncharacterized protein n=1 Tax=Paenibacillus crassostreae TaxID=1763538 RepID=A0A167BVU7_9BACL|nr:hypothetical protein [Paenibacillus crassostreae]AOZ92552.1 hypothetical protein LPB68_10090 [Paenibacillus crassostreae]OAB72500.1 hypothetical protein PNBC_16535 [Paenibacillus crassostreae]